STTVRQTPLQATEAPSAMSAVSHRVEMTSRRSSPGASRRTSRLPKSVMIPVNMRHYLDAPHPGFQQIAAHLLYECKPELRCYRQALKMQRLDRGTPIASDDLAGAKPKQTIDPGTLQEACRNRCPALDHQAGYAAAREFAQDCFGLGTAL